MTLKLRFGIGALAVLIASSAHAADTKTLPRTPIKSPGLEQQEIIDEAERLAADGSSSKAIEELEVAEANAKAAKNSLGVGALALSLAAQENRAGNPKKASDTLYRALDAYRDAKDPADTAIVFMELGALEQNSKVGLGILGVQSSYENASKEFENAGYYEESAFARLKMGQVMQRRGRFLRAIEVYSKILFGAGWTGQGSIRPNGYGNREALSLAGVATASAYAALGDYEFARYLVSIHILILGPDSIPLAYAAGENELAKMDARDGNYAEAARAADQGLIGARRIGDRALEAELLFRRGAARSWLKQDGAQADFDDAAKIVNELGDEHLRAILLLELAQLTIDPKAARQPLIGSINRFNTYPDAVPRLRAMALYAEACAKTGDSEQAKQAFDRAAAEADEIAEDLPSQTDLRVTFYREYQYIFDAIAELYLEKNDLEHAYFSVQSKKARGILGATSLTRGPLVAHLTQDETLTLAGNLKDVAHYERQYLAALEYGSDDYAARAWLNIRKMESNSYVSALLARHTEIPEPPPTPLADPEYLARFVPQDTALMEYAVLDSALGQRMIFLVATTNSGKLDLKLFDLKGKDGKPISPRQFADLAIGFRTAVKITAATAALQSLAADLYRLLVEPAGEIIRNKKRLVICPDGAIWAIPFQALIGADGKYLVENYEIDYEYSASTFVTAVNPIRASSPPDSKRVLVVADPVYGSRERFVPDLSDEARNGAAAASNDTSWIPELPQALWEGNAIQTIFPNAKLLTRAEAQESRVRTELAHYDYVHFATHVIVFNDQPFLSALVLATPNKTETGDGFLTARELMDLALKAEMVVLSACNTGTGEQRGSEGILGLGWALFVAGSPAQVLTQWPVNDASTAEFMAAFYAKLREGRSKGQALNAATLKLLANPKTRHPFYWAPIYLIGDYR